MDKDFEDRLDLLEQRYMVTSERLSKLERVQYQIRDQIGFIQFLSKSEDSQQSIETRMTEIYQAINQLMDQMDNIHPPRQSASTHNLPVAQTLTPAQQRQTQTLQSPVKAQTPQPVVPIKAPQTPVQATRTQSPQVQSVVQQHKSAALRHIDHVLPHKPSPDISLNMASKHPSIEYKAPANKPLLIKN